MCLHFRETNQFFYVCCEIRTQVHDQIIGQRVADFVLKPDFWVNSEMLLGELSTVD